MNATAWNVFCKIMMEEDFLIFCESMGHFMGRFGVTTWIECHKKWDNEND